MAEPLDVDICVTCISDKPPQLPLREELNSLGVEIVYRAHGAGALAVRREKERKMEEFRRKEMEKQQGKCLPSLPQSPKKKRKKQQERERMEKELRHLKSISYDEYVGVLRETESGGYSPHGDSRDMTEFLTPSSVTKQGNVSSSALSYAMQEGNAQDIAQSISMTSAETVDEETVPSNAEAERIDSDKHAKNTEEALAAATDAFTLASTIPVVKSNSDRLEDERFKHESESFNKSGVDNGVGSSNVHVKTVQDQAVADAFAVFDSKPDSASMHSKQVDSEFGCEEPLHKNSLESQQETQAAVGAQQGQEHPAMPSSRPNVPAAAFTAAAVTTGALAAAVLSTQESRSDEDPIPEDNFSGKEAASFFVGLPYDMSSDEIEAASLDRVSKSKDDTKTSINAVPDDSTRGSSSIGSFSAVTAGASSAAALSTNEPRPETKNQDSIPVDTVAGKEAASLFVVPQFDTSSSDEVQASSLDQVSKSKEVTKTALDKLFDDKSSENSSIESFSYTQKPEDTVSKDASNQENLDGPFHGHQNLESWMSSALKTFTTTLFGNDEDKNEDSATNEKSAIGQGHQAVGPDGAKLAPPPKRDLAATSALFSALTQVTTQPDDVRKLLDNSPGMARLSLGNDGRLPLHVACDKDLPYRTLWDPSSESSLLIKELNTDMSNHLELIDIVSRHHMDACMVPDAFGDLPVHLLARRLIKWEEHWEKELLRVDLISKADSDAVTILYQTMSHCIEIVLEPVASTRILCRARGSAGRILPLHIAAWFGVSSSCLTRLLEEYPEAAAVPCDFNGIVSNKLNSSLPLELFECRKDLSKGFPTSAEPGNEDCQETQVLQLSTESSRDSVLKSDLLFAFNPSILPFRQDPERIKRIESMVQVDAKRLAREDDNKELKPAPRSAWIWLCTFDDGIDDQDTYVETVRHIVDSLDSVAVKELAMTETEDGTILLDVALPECAKILRERIGHGVSQNRELRVPLELDSETSEEGNLMTEDGDTREESTSGVYEEVSPSEPDDSEQAQGGDSTEDGDIRQKSISGINEEVSSSEPDDSDQAQGSNSTEDGDIKEESISGVNQEVSSSEPDKSEQVQGNNSTSEKDWKLERTPLTESSSMSSLDEIKEAPENRENSEKIAPGNEQLVSAMITKSSESSPIEQEPMPENIERTSAGLAHSMAATSSESLGESESSLEKGIPSSRLSPSDASGIEKGETMAAVPTEAAEKVDVGVLCKAIFNVKEEAFPSSFVIMPYKLKKGPGGTLTLESPEYAHVAMKFAQCLLRMTEAWNVFHVLEKKSVEHLGHKISQEHIDEWRQRDEKNASMELVLLSLYDSNKGYLYFLDECTGVPMVDSSSEVQDAYPIEIADAVDTVQRLLPLMLMGMVRMRGERALAVLAKTIMQASEFDASPGWIQTSHDIVASIHLKEKRSDESISSTTSELVSLGEELIEYQARVASSDSPKRPESKTGCEWIVELSFMKTLLEKLDSRSAYAGLKPLKNKRRTVLWTCPKEESTPQEKDVAEISSKPQDQVKSKSSAVSLSDSDSDKDNSEEEDELDQDSVPSAGTHTDNSEPQDSDVSSTESASNEYVSSTEPLESHRLDSDNELLSIGGKLPAVIEEVDEDEFSQAESSTAEDDAYTSGFSYGGFEGSTVNTDTDGSSRSGDTTSSTSTIILDNENDLRESLFTAVRDGLPVGVGTSKSGESSSQTSQSLARSMDKKIEQNRSLSNFLESNASNLEAKRLSAQNNVVLSSAEVDNGRADVFQSTIGSRHVETSDWSMADTDQEKKMLGLSKVINYRSPYMNDQDYIVMSRSENSSSFYSDDDSDNGDRDSSHLKSRQGWIVENSSFTSGSGIEVRRPPTPKSLRQESTDLPSHQRVVNASSNDDWDMEDASFSDGSGIEASRLPTWNSLKKPMDSSSPKMQASALGAESTKVNDETPPRAYIESSSYSIPVVNEPETKESSRDSSLVSAGTQEQLSRGILTSDESEDESSILLNSYPDDGFQPEDTDESTESDDREPTYNEEYNQGLTTSGSSNTNDLESDSYAPQSTDKMKSSYHHDNDASSYAGDAEPSESDSFTEARSFSSTATPASLRPPLVPSKTMQAVRASRSIEADKTAGEKANNVGLDSFIGNNRETKSHCRAYSDDALGEDNESIHRNRELPELEALSLGSSARDASDTEDSFAEAKHSQTTETSYDTATSRTGAPGRVALSDTSSTGSSECAGYDRFDSSTATGYSLEYAGQDSVKSASRSPTVVQSNAHEKDEFSELSRAFGSFSEEEISAFSLDLNIFMERVRDVVSESSSTAERRGDASSSMYAGDGEQTSLESSHGWTTGDNTYSDGSKHHRGLSETSGTFGESTTSAPMSSKESSKISLDFDNSTMDSDAVSGNGSASDTPSKARNLLLAVQPQEESPPTSSTCSFEDGESIFTQDSMESIRSFVARISSLEEKVLQRQLDLQALKLDVQVFELRATEQSFDEAREELTRAQGTWGEATSWD